MSNLALIDDSRIINALQSEDLGEAWEAYKSYNNISFTSPKEEKDAVLMMRANRLNPIKKECYIVPISGRNTLVVAYQTLLKRAYEAGYDSKNVNYQERVIESYKPNSTGTKFEKIEDLECTASLKTSEGKIYSFVGLFSQYKQVNKTGELSFIWKEKPILMLRKCVLSGLFRTLPNSGLQGMPYTQDEMTGEEVKATVTSIDEEQDHFMNLLGRYVQKVSDLQIELELSSEEAERWTNRFYECGEVSCLRGLGRELKEFLESKKQGNTALGLKVEEKQDTSKWDNN